ncbi:MAG: phage holin family protein [Solirubrobacterales bacterium]
MSGRAKSILGTVLRAGALIVFNGLVIYWLSWLLPHFEVDSAIHGIEIALALSIVNVLLWPLVISLALRFAVFTFGIGSMLISGAIITLLAEWIDGVTVDFWSAVLVGVIITIVNILATTVLSLGERDWYYERVVTRAARRVARRQGREIHQTDVPGVFFLEIDGLAEPVLRRAITNGHMPTLARWMQEGTHRIVRWECDLSSQTSASQAGLLLGSNEGIPAFRWYERETGELVTSSNAGDVAKVEERLSNGEGLLAYGGTSRGNLMSGDAPRSLLTLSRVREKLYSRDFYAYFADPYNPPRTFTLAAFDIATELIEAARQRRLDVQPRVDRGGIYPLLRCGMTVIMRDFNIFSLMGDLFEGVPVSYATFVGYDEVAHHSGIERRDALDVLRRLDRQFARLERVAKHAPRPYEFVVLSDHGQSQGATFLQRFGLTLEDLVRQAIADGGHDVAMVDGVDEAWGSIGTAITQAANSSGATATVVRAAARPRLDETGQVALGPEQDQIQLREAIESSSDKPDTIVLASGNLGLIYMPEEAQRCTRERLEVAYPGLLTTLATHPGVGFVMVTTENDGPVAIGADGMQYLRDGRVEGKDPLEHFGPHAARHLARNDGFKNAPDVYVVSMYDPQSGEVAAFEELVGSHGGLGGMQAEPFAFVPKHWSEGPEEIIGAGEMHKVLIRWLEEGGLREGSPGI